jgi:hypothetical protein
VYQFICTEQIPPRNNEVQRSVSGSSVWNFMSPFWHLEFECGTYIFGKFVDFWNRWKMHTKIHFQNLEEWKHFDNPDIDRRIILRLILKKQNIRGFTESYGSENGLVAGCYEHGSTTLEFNKGRDISWLCERALPSQTSLCSAELFWIWHSKLDKFIGVR